MCCFVGVGFLDFGLVSTLENQDVVFEVCFDYVLVSWGLNGRLGNGSGCWGCGR